tara:strand:+ start:36602 stop:37003 length:402 start_codon:yes stop_codon:yes gene_type:complete
MVVSVILYSIIGVSIELVFNAIRTALTKKGSGLSLKGSVSIWMLPIYGFGLTYGFDFIYYCASDHNVVRWLTYPLWVWLVELAVGLPTKNKIWDYSDIKYNWRGVISPLHYPAWACFGIIIENLRMYTDSILI